MNASSQTWIVVADDPAVSGLVVAARTLSAEVTAVVAGRRATAESVAASGVDRVLWLGEPAEGTPVEAYAPDVARTVADAAPGAVLGSPEGAGRVMLGAIAALLQAPVLSGVTTLEHDGDRIGVTRSVFGGIAEHAARDTDPVTVMFEGRDPAQHRCLQQRRDRAEHDASCTLRRAEHRSGCRIRDSPRHVGGIRLDGRPFGGLAEPQDTIHTCSGDGLRRRTPAGHHSGHLGAEGPRGHDEPTHGGIVGNHDPRLGRDAHGFPLLSVVCGRGQPGRYRTLAARNAPTSSTAAAAASEPSMMTRCRFPAAGRDVLTAVRVTCAAGTSSVSRGSTSTGFLASPRGRSP